MQGVKVLFVCRANIGRSQAASELYNKLRLGTGCSAGTIVDLPGQLLKNQAVASTILSVMWERGIDMSNNQRTAIESLTCDDFDKIVIMAELQSTPVWLENHPKSVRWNIDDPLDRTIDDTRFIVDKILNNIDQL
jgi:protein-tyrosine-phosphatase